MAWARADGDRSVAPMHPTLSSLLAQSLIDDRARISGALRTRRARVPAAAPAGDRTPERTIPRAR